MQKLFEVLDLKQMTSTLKILSNYAQQEEKNEEEEMSEGVFADELQHVQSLEDENVELLYEK